MNEPEPTLRLVIAALRELLAELERVVEALERREERDESDREDETP